MKSVPPKKPRFKGIRLPKGYENTLQESVEQDLRDPEDQNTPEIPNEIKKYGSGGFNG